jgi:N-acetyl-gamma-glutamylphosphate reductase
MRGMGLRVAVYGGSGYTGGELLRLLVGHPEVGAIQVTSR